MTVAIETEQRGTLCIKVSGVASAAAAGIGEIANPEGVNVVILRATLFIHKKSTGAANLSVGVTTEGASATDILNALDVNGATNDTVYNGHAMQNTAKTEITAPALWTPAKYVTFTGSATTVGLEAYLFLEYIRAV